MLTPQIAQDTLAFLHRVDLKGGEAPAFINCIYALNQVVSQAGAAPAAAPAAAPVAKKPAAKKPAKTPA